MAVKVNISEELSRIDKTAEWTLDTTDFSDYCNYRDFLCGDPDIVIKLTGFILDCLEVYRD